ncbi:MAG: YncE family protein [Chitinophagaceae bacterium]|nr:MAG: YncE family protein [Chitinophagaceae bacterium]
MRKTQLLLMSAAFAVTFTACKKDDVIEMEQPKVTHGLYVLNEGGFNQNNSTLTFYNTTNNTTTADIFRSANGSDLGDTGNDMIVYGGKIYIVVNVTGTVEVANVNDAKTLKRIDFKSGGFSTLPRYIVGYKNKVLVSSYDGTVAVVDTTSLTAEKFITVGANPEQMAIVNDKLYVANSGGYNPVYDSTVSEVDLLTMTETKKIVVGMNPGSVTADNNGNVYVACTGDYGATPAKLVKFNASSGAIVKSADTAVGKIYFYDNKLYTTGGYIGSPNVRVLNTTDFAQTAANFVTDGTTITTPYGIAIDNLNGDVFITDANNFTGTGSVTCFDKTGKKRYSFNAGANPNTVVLLK